MLVHPKYGVDVAYVAISSEMETTLFAAVLAEKIVMALLARVPMAEEQIFQYWHHSEQKFARHDLQIRKMSLEPSARLK